MSDYPELSMSIDGEWVGVGHRRVHQVLNPATGGVLGELPLADAADLDRALDAADRGFRLWRARPADERARVLKGAADLMRQRADRIARIATTEEGKTFGEARIETMATAGWLEFAGEEAKRNYGRVLTRPTGQRHMVLREPVGPVAAFAPWNFPVGNPGRKLGAALAAGCSCILKPAEEAPNSAIEVLRALLDAGLPPGVAQVVFGVPDEVSRHLLSSKVIRKLSFTGSVAVMAPFKTYDDVVEQANRLPYGLAAYAFTQSSKRSMLIGDALEAGMVAINTVSIAGADSPFGGVKESGHGSEDGPEGVQACQVIKSISMA